MFNTHDGGPAHPCLDGLGATRSDAPGLSKLEHFAGLAMHAIYMRFGGAGSAGNHHDGLLTHTANDAFAMGEAMLAAADQNFAARHELERRANWERQRGDRFEKLLRAVWIAADGGQVGQTEQLRVALADAKLALDEDELPF